MAESRTTSVFRFEVETEDLPFRRLLDIGEELIAVLREVDQEVAPDAHMRWVVESVSKSSPFKLRVQPVPTRSETPASAPRDVVRTLNAGIRHVQRQAERPEHFTDRALRKAKALVETATAGGAVVRIGTGRSVVRVDDRLIRNVDAILGTTVSEIGTVEGRLEAFNVHGNNRYFNIYDSLTGARIRCDFGHRISVSEIGASAERRVAVYGEIKYRETGERVNVIAHRLDLFPTEEELPSADDVLGILAE